MWFITKNLRPWKSELTIGMCKHFFLSGIQSFCTAWEGGIKQSHPRVCFRKNELKASLGVVHQEESKQKSSSNVWKRNFQSKEKHLSGSLRGAHETTSLCGSVRMTEKQSRETVEEKRLTEGLQAQVSLQIKNQSLPPAAASRQSSTNQRQEQLELWALRWGGEKRPFASL